jgi:hypothetical protein
LPRQKKSRVPSTLLRGTPRGNGESDSRYWSPPIGRYQVNFMLAAASTKELQILAKAADLMRVLDLGLFQMYRITAVTARMRQVATLLRNASVRQSQCARDR